MVFLQFQLQHLRLARSSPSPSQSSCLGGDPVTPGLAPLMLVWTQTGWRWAQGSILVYFQLLMTSLSLQYVSMTASLKKASTTWSSICKCQSQGPLPSVTPSVGPSASSDSGRVLSLHRATTGAHLCRALHHSQTYPTYPPLTWLCAGFYPQICI